MRRKCIIGVVFFLITIFTSMASGCMLLLGGIGEAITEDIQFTSDDGGEALTAPYDWDVDPDLNEDAIIQISNSFEDEFVMVIEDTKDSFADDMQLSDFTDMVLTNVYSNITNPEISEITDITVGGNPAQCFKVIGEYSKLKITYVYYCVEAKDSYYQIVGGALSSDFEEYGDEISSVMDSFELVKPPGQII